MYKMFKRNLENYMSNTSTTKLYRDRIVEPLRGLADKSVYEQWKKEQADQYDQISELIYYINESIDRFPRFETFIMDLWGLGYNSKETSKPINEEVYEQLKLIDLCLAAAYL